MNARSLGIPAALVRLREAAIGCYLAEHPADLEVSLAALPGGAWRAGLEIEGSLAESVEGPDPHDVLDELAKRFGGWGEAPAPVPSRAGTLLRFPTVAPYTTRAPLTAPRSTTPAPQCRWTVGDRVREPGPGPTVFFVPTTHERPARTGTVVSILGAALVAVHWDGAPAPSLDPLDHDALALAAWLEPATANDLPDLATVSATPERTAP